MVGGGARTLKHNNTNMATKTNIKRKLQRLDSEIEDDLEQLNIAGQTTSTFSHFLMIESTDKSRPVTSLSAFAVDKTIKGCAGTVKQVKKCAQEDC